jgi:L-aspartate oxidase
LHHPAVPRPLLSEALRGHGALLRDAKGERFVDELLPRDAVARAMTARMLEQDVDHLWLDATGLDHFDERFPTIAAAVRAVGLDPATDWFPIAPAAHYQCGGIVTDLDGATSLPGLWAAGEVACTGIHGANRLASNSLLEGMVYGPRVIEAIERGETEAKATGAMRAVIDDGMPDLIGGRVINVAFDSVESTTSAGGSPVAARERLQRTMTTGAGVVRSAASLAETSAIVDEVRSSCAVSPTDAEAAENRNFADVAHGILAAAAARQESRGAHTRTDFPSLDEGMRVRLVLR